MMNHWLYLTLNIIPDFSDWNVIQLYKTAVKEKYEIQPYFAHFENFQKFNFFDKKLYFEGFAGIQ